MIIAGVDEAGRGSLAGPVVAGAVVLKEGDYPAELMVDSKQLSLVKREEAYEWIIRNCEYGIGISSGEVVDQVGIKKATQAAMQKAVQNLSVKPEILHIDGNDKFVFTIDSKDFIRGDETNPEISAASIIAKVSRDRYMVKIDKKYPEFEFGSNKGYGTERHRMLLEEMNYCPEHRKTYEPLKTLLIQGKLF